MIGRAGLAGQAGPTVDVRFFRKFRRLILAAGGALHGTRGTEFRPEQNEASGFRADARRTLGVAIALWGRDRGGTGNARTQRKYSRRGQIRWPTCGWQIQQRAESPSQDAYNANPIRCWRGLENRWPAAGVARGEGAFAVLGRDHEQKTGRQQAEKKYTGGFRRIRGVIQPGAECWCAWGARGRIHSGVRQRPGFPAALDHRLDDANPAAAHVLDLLRERGSDIAEGRRASMHWKWWPAAIVIGGKGPKREWRGTKGTKGMTGREGGNWAMLAIAFFGIS